MNKLSGVLNNHLILVVDADKDLEEMKEVFIKQENMLMGRGRTKQNTEDKENIAQSVGCKRLAVDNIKDGGRKMILLEKGQI